LIDFGQAKSGLFGEDARTQTICGTPAYFAPELLKGTAYTKAVDWWSLGTMCYEMLWGTGPFYCESEADMYVQIMEGQLLFDESGSPEVNDFLGRLLDRDPDTRLKDPNEMKKHPWFAGLDWKKLERLELEPPFKPQLENEKDLSNLNQDLLKEPTNLDEIKEDLNSRKATVDPFDGFTFRGGA